MATPEPAVDAYLAQVAGPRRDAVLPLRDLCLEHLPGCTEGMKYGMPGYWRGPVAEGEGERSILDMTAATTGPVC